MDFQTLFRTTNPTRDKLLARFFGLFSEELVRWWCANPRSPYDNLGRPSVFVPGSTRPRTLDFALRNKADEIFVAEQKFWPEYQNYRFLTIETVDQVERFSNRSFEVFRAFAKNPSDFTVTVDSKKVEVAGAIFVTGKISMSGRTAIETHYGFQDLLSLEDISRDLAMWKDPSFLDGMNERKDWSNDLFETLMDH